MSFSTITPQTTDIKQALQNLTISIDELKAIVTPAPPSQVNPYIVQQLFTTSYNGTAVFGTVAPYRIASSFTGDGSAISRASFIFNSQSSPVLETFHAELWSVNASDMPLSVIATSNSITLASSAVVSPPSTAHQLQYNELISFDFDTSQSVTNSGTRYAIVLVMDAITFLDATDFGIRVYATAFAGIVSDFSSMWQPSGSSWSQVSGSRLLVQILGV